MVLKTDKSKVTEGDIIEVKWECPNSESTTLTLDNGHSSSTIQVEGSGTKKFRLNRVGKTTITVKSAKNGKSSNKGVKVRVSARKYDTYQRVGDNKFKELCQNFTQKIKNYTSRYKYGWSMMPKDKKQASISLMIILGIMIISSFFPSAVFFGISVLAIYCFYILMKK